MEPTGEERQIKPYTSAAIDHTPVAYIIILAAVVAAFSFLPLSISFTSGKPFPLSQAIYPLVGWLLGPIAGATASAVGMLINVVSQSLTTQPLAFVSVLGGFSSSLTAGIITSRGLRRNWWIPLAAFYSLVFGIYLWRAVGFNGIRPWVAALNTFIDWSALLLLILPTRQLAARWISSPDIRRVGMGMFLGTWAAAGLSHLVNSAIYYLINPWPEPVWIAIAWAAPLENATRSLVGALVGSGLVAGLRAIRLIRPPNAAY